MTIAELRQRLRAWLPMLFPVILGAALRITLLFTRGELWFDELYTIHVSALPTWAETVRIWAIDTHPPLQYFLLHFYLPTISAHLEFWTRLPSVIFGVAAIALLYIIGKKAFSIRTGFLAALLLALSPIHLVMSTEVRIYSLLTLLTIASIFLFYRIAWTKASRSIWIIFFFVQFLLLYSHLTAIVVIGIEFFFFFLLEKDRRKQIRWTLAHLELLLVWCPWLIPAILSKLNGHLGSAWYFDPGVYGNTNLMNMLVDGFGAFTSGSLLFTLVALATICLLGFTMMRTSREEPRARLLSFFLLTVGLLPIIMSAMLGVYVPKYLLIAYPALFLFLAQGLGPLLKSRMQTILVTIFILAILVPGTWLVATSPVFSFAPFFQTIEKDKTSHSIILIPPPEALVMKQYYHGSIPVIAMTVATSSITDQDLAENNWHLQQATQQDVSRWLCSTLMAHHADRVFLIENSTGFDWIRQMLDQMGWIEGNTTPALGYYQYVMHEIRLPAYHPAYATSGCPKL